MFGSIFNIYHGALILCCTTTDLGIFWYCSGDYWSCICKSPAIDMMIPRFLPTPSTFLRFSLETDV